MTDPDLPIDLTDLSIDTRLIHSDHRHSHEATAGDVAPPLHLSTTFDRSTQSAYTYSRDSNPTRTRVETLLSSLDGGNALVYSSGQAATQAVIQALQPTNVYLLPDGYYGTQHQFDIYIAQNRKHGVHINVIHDISDLQDGMTLDLIWCEVPNNPWCHMADFAALTALAQKHTGCYLVCDATMCSPCGVLPLQHGVDIVMHSATKYLAGHSDVTAGVLCIAKQHTKLYETLQHERTETGSVPGQLECYLLLRSLRTLHVRFERASSNACKLAEMLDVHPAVTRVHHPVLPSHPSHALAQKYILQHTACFGVELQTAEQARTLTQHMKIGRNATSLGGNETLVDYRYFWDTEMPQTLIRISVGIEHIDDIIGDFQQALDKVADKT